MSSFTTPQPLPGPRTTIGSDRGVAMLMMTAILSLVALLIATAVFRQSRLQRFETMRNRAKIHARYASEYAVARYGVPVFLRSSDQIDVNTSNNYIEPRTRENFLNTDFANEDLFYGFAYDYKNLKMDKFFDLVSSKPFYTVSATGVVRYKDHTGVDRTAEHTTAVSLTFSDFSRFMYFSNGEISMEGGDVTFKSGDEFDGRIHVNGEINISTASCCPIFHGLVTQTGENVNGISPSQYDQIFQGGLILPFPEIEWPPSDAVAQIKEQRVSNHTYDDVVIDPVGEAVVGDPLTTYLKFDGDQYWVAQYVPGRFSTAGDTIYVPHNGQNWVRKNLPTLNGRELVYVKGVCRLEGIIQGRLTVLSSDTMFIMDDIITSDTDIYACNNELEFGMVPLGSPNRIGLASERDIIVASTLENGFANGRFSPGITCGLPNDPVVSSCSQGRKDVIITAAVFAVGCSFQAEFWNNSCSGAPRPGSSQHPDGCFGSSYTHTYIWGQDRPPCAGAPPLQDERGTIWLCGSVVQTHRGFVYRNPIGPWGNAWIGYFEKKYRYDDNFLTGGPPVWFTVKYSDGSQEIATEKIIPDYSRWLTEREARGLDQEN
jgi:hypothetical protein